MIENINYLTSVKFNIHGHLTVPPISGVFEELLFGDESGPHARYYISNKRSV